jgi:hypothetical protein
MENLVVGQANLFAFVLNEGHEPMNLILRVQTPDFRPQECVYRLMVDPYSSEPESLMPIPISASLPHALSATRIVWQRQGCAYRDGHERFGLRGIRVDHQAVDALLRPEIRCLDPQD